MDAAQTNIKKLAFFLATALLLTATVNATPLPTLTVSSTQISIGSASCNSSQPLVVTSSDGSDVPYTVKVQYSGSSPDAGDQFGNWLYVKDNTTGGATTTGAAFNDTTGTSGNSLLIGLNLSIGAVTPTASVVLTPTNGSPAVSVTVFYSQATSCGGNTGNSGNGVLTVTPGNIAFTPAANSTASQPLNVQNVTGNALTFTVTTQGGSWLSASANSVTLSPNGSATVTVTGDASKLVGTNSGTGTVLVQAYLGSLVYGTVITVPVTIVTNGNGGGGGGSGSGTFTVNGATSSTFTTSFSFTAPNTPGPQCIPIQDTASGANSYSYNVTTSGGGSWLLANFATSGSTFGLLAPTSNACVTVSLSNINSLASGAYQGTIALTSSSGATATINVNLYVSSGAAQGVTVSPALIWAFPGVAVGSSSLQQQSFTVTASQGVTLGAASLSAGASTSGFSLSNVNVNGSSETFTVTSNPAGLPAGLYSAVVSIGSSGTASGTTNVTVALPVGQGGNTGGGGGGGNVSTVAAPPSLSFQQQQGNSFWTGGQEAQAVTITGQQGTTWNASIIYGAGGSNWLQFDSPASGSGTFGSGPTTLLVDLYNGVQSLSPSATAYTATINITTGNGNATVNVSLLVTAANDPVLIGKPSLLTFSSSNGSIPASQATTIVGSDNTGSTSSPLLNIGTPTVTWASATSNGNTMTVSVNPSGQASGLYSGTIPVTSSAYSHPINYPVVLLVNGAGGSTGSLTLSSTSISFTNVTGTLSQSLNVSAASSTSFTATSNETNCTQSSWLSISPSGQLVAPASPSVQAITVQVIPVGIANGTTCSGTVTLTASGGLPQTVNVSMTVGSSGTGGNVTVNPTTMTFTYTQNQTVPPAQNATVVNAASSTGAIPFTVATAVTSGSTNWLQTNLTSGQTPLNSPGLSVSVAPTGLNPGTYTGTVTVTPTGGSAQTINVTLQVNASAVVTANPTTLTLSYTVGGNSPTSTIQVSGGGAVAGFTATASSGSGFLKVSPTTGTTANTGTFPLNVTVDPTVLATLLPGSYTGTITVSGVSPATGTNIVTVTLNVTAPLPTITSVTNAASSTGGPVSPGEFISIFANQNLANPIGPLTPVLLNATTCPNGCTQLPTLMGGVQVIFLPSGVAAPLTYVSGSQINALVPYEVSTSNPSISVEVKYLGQTSNAFPLTVTALNPGIFTSNGAGTGQAAVAMYDTTGAYKGNNSAANPAQKGWLLSIYMTGEGILNPAAKTGSVTATTEVPFVVPTVLIDGQPASLGGYAEAGGIVSGVLQVNAFVPQTVHSGTVSLTVSLGTASAQTGVTVFIQ